MRAVFVTGANGAIGRAIVEAFEADGGRVFRQDIAENPDTRQLDVKGDLREASVIQRIHHLVDAERVSAIVAAHGIPASYSIRDTTREILERSIHVNLSSVIDLYEAVVSSRFADGGIFVCVSSQAGLVGELNNGPYCAAKFGLVGWARARAGDGSPAIRVLCPGATDTPLLQSALEGMAAVEGISFAQMMKRRNSASPLGRLGSTSEIASAAKWLCRTSQPNLIVAPVTGGEVMI